MSQEWSHLNLDSAQEMLYKNQSKENNYKKTEQDRGTVLLQCNLIYPINMHTKFGVI